MIPSHIRIKIKEDDLNFNSSGTGLFVLPKYDARTHYLEITRSGYFRALTVLRHYIKIVSDYYFCFEVGAKNIDLFMLTNSVSSPMGPGSDSKSIPIKFGRYKSNLVDSSQFGFEPLLLNEIDRVYCYLPSMRGENPDKRHLNQFFHCELEIKGGLEDLKPIIEEYVKILSEALILMPNILTSLSINYNETVKTLNEIINSKKFTEMTFDEAVNILTKNNSKDLVNFTKFGRSISSEGEVKVATIQGFKKPFWIKNYDRDMVPFYQKPFTEDLNKAVSADLIFPPIIDNSFGGEIVGSGQRQDNHEEILRSIKRQGINPKPYEWYINLRRQPNYQITSGFGLGIERFITWALCRDDIKDAILYPRLKNFLSHP